MQKIAVVWLKRDLRLSDHEPLATAIRGGLPVLLIYCFEPSLVAAPQSDDRHWRFVWESLEELKSRLKNLQSTVAIFHAEVKEVFEKLMSEFQIQTVYSHQETGIKITYDRDLRLNGKNLPSKACSVEGKIETDGEIPGLVLRKLRFNTLI